PGYSLSLPAVKADPLIGIGYGDWNSTLKIEVYTETDSKVESVAEYELENTSFSQEYKAYFIDKESGLVGLAVRETDAQYKYHYKYLVLWFDGYDLVKLDLDIPFADSYINSSYVRACRVENYLYVLSENEFYAVKLG
ncbi:MAG: beta-propeller domain-containing protein, partial [Clostridiales bacterium]|nr:beta-propeller domain-containing protein [Clostridiales bacterium]